LTRQALGRDIGNLVVQAKRGAARKRKVCEALPRLATRADLPALRRFFARSPIDNDTRDLVLALCRVGTARDCSLILRRIAESRSFIDLYNHVRIADALASIATEGLRPMLIRSFESPEFWAYIEASVRRPRNRLPIRCIENQALVRRLLAACFVRVAKRRDRGRLKKLLTHNYDWIAQKAASTLAQFGKESDLDELNEILLQAKDIESPQVNGLLEGVRALDQALYARPT
jgi:HEAT repeat protein